MARQRREPGPAERLRAAGEGPRAVHQLLARQGAMGASETAHALYGPEAPARRVTNQLHALRKRGLALEDRSTRRWEAVDV